MNASQQTLVSLADAFLLELRVSGYSPRTVEGLKQKLRRFIKWSTGIGMDPPDAKSAGPNRATPYGRG